jgi:23S rRNA (guanine745-N1)-methyltransferase
MAVTLLCPVRGCGQTLTRGERALSCPRGHAFDVARSGYLNLLQPQDRRSAAPGDRKEAAAARRRLYAAGHAEPLLAALRAELDGFRPLPLPAVLDVGCGEGTLLGTLAAERPLEAHGLDLSVAAVELAARRYPDPTWVVANADRLLPYAEGSFDVVLVLSARLNTPELRRVIAPSGSLLVATPGPDDLVELRGALLGEPLERNRLSRAITALAPAFALESRTSVRHAVDLDAAAIRDVLAATYRGARHSQQARLAHLEGMRVTMSHDVGRFRPASSTRTVRTTFRVRAASSGSMETS